MKRTVWTAPTIERAASTLLAAALPTTYQQGDSFQLLTRESGSVRRDLPIWVSKPDIVRWSESFGPVVRTDVPGVRGAFVLSHVLTTEECDQILKLSQSMGYTEVRTRRLAPWPPPPNPTSARRARRSKRYLHSGPTCSRHRMLL